MFSEASVCPRGGGIEGMSSIGGTAFEGGMHLNKGVCTWIVGLHLKGSGSHCSSCHASNWNALLFLEMIAKYGVLIRKMRRLLVSCVARGVYEQNSKVKKNVRVDDWTAVRVSVPKRSLPTAYVVLGKVMFSQASVCSQGEVGADQRGDRCPVWYGQTPPKTRHIPPPPPDQSPTRPQTRHLQPPPPPDKAPTPTPNQALTPPPPPRYGEPAVGTHPTGMHSCLKKWSCVLT